MRLWPWVSCLAITSMSAAMLGGCLRASFAVVNVPAYFGAYTRTKDVPYGADPQQRLDVYRPKRARPNAPLIVFWHGGRWEFGDKSQYRFVASALCELGYVAVLPNYRHYPQVKMAGFMQDAAAAVVWAHTHARELGADPAQIYVMGHSAGAHLAALLALDDRYLQAASPEPVPLAGVIGLSGVYDFLPLTEDDTRDMFGPPENYQSSQPIHFVHAGAPRMLLVHGADDRTVYPKNSIHLAAALKAAGVPVTLYLYPKRKHADTVAALSPLAKGRAPVREQIREFVAASRAGG